jgi:ATP-binding cassette subfamily B protein
VRGLSFAHDGAPPGVRHLDDISLEVPEGATLGIVGTVGSGKSTLLGLLPRALETPPGKVFIGGEDVATMPLDRLRRNIAVVPQEPFLFRRSIRENVQLAPLEFRDDDLESAVSRSCLAKDLDHFPDGLDTVIGERGITLSGGQRQRATIARALIVKPPILILDDALSSLDAQVEHEIIGHLRGMKGESTMIIVSNRIASLSWADKIIVMDRGSIVESGTHGELMDKGGLYARIAAHQTLASRLEEI